MPNLDTELNETSGAIFDLDLPDSDLLNFIRTPLVESETYFTETLGLKKIREKNVNLWLPKHWKDADLYDYQEENTYQNPRIFVSVETLCSIVNSRIAQPSIMPAQDTETSMQLAKDIQDASFAFSKKYRVNDLYSIALRNHMLKREAYIKLRFDSSIGKHGEIIPEFVMPEDIIVDKDARYGDIPRFIAQRYNNKTFEELIAMFPESEQELLKLAGVNRKNKKGELVAYKSQLGKKQPIYEVWFRYYKDLKIMSGVAWVDDNFTVVLGKMENPNWNYEEDTEEGSVGNILDAPEPPFIPINLFNDGSSWIDQTSMIEQAEALQRIHNKRGFQIMENADQAGSGLVFNTVMISKEDIAQLTGSPDERVGVKGDVRSAVARVQPPPLPSYVMEDKIYAAQQIDDIFGTHDISRGKESGNKTLGQDQLQVNQDYTRLDNVSRAIERSATKFYKYLIQMMKVYYTEDHWFKLKGEDGQYDFIRMKSDLIEDGIDIEVEAGSTLPINKQSQLSFAGSLAKSGMIDPLTLYEVGSGMPMPTPKKMLERLIAYKTDPMKYAGIAQSDDFDRKAMMDIQILNAGEMPIPRDDISAQYLNYFHKYMTSSDFQKAIAGKPEIEKLYTIHLLEAQRIASNAMQLMQQLMPTPQEQDMANQKAVTQAEQTRAISGGATPQQPPQQPQQKPQIGPPKPQAPQPPQQMMMPVGK